MLLEDAAAAGGGEKPESCTVAVPPWWTQQQRHAMLDAAHIAGLKNPSIVSEAAAAAMQLSHRYPPGGGRLFIQKFSHKIHHKP